MLAWVQSPNSFLILFCCALMKSVLLRTLASRHKVSIILCRMHSVGITNTVLASYPTVPAFFFAFYKKKLIWLGIANAIPYLSVRLFTGIYIAMNLCIKGYTCSFDIIIPLHLSIAAHFQLHYFSIQNHSIGSGQSVYCEIPRQFHLFKSGCTIFGHRLGSNV